jgi:hypothetical protein
MGSGGRAPRILNMGTIWKWVVNFTLQGKEPGPCLDVMAELKLAAPAGNGIPVVQPVVSRCTYNSVSIIFRAGRLERELQMAQLSATRLQLYSYSVSQFSEFCRHNPLCWFSTSVYCCLFRYRLSPETFGLHPRIWQLGWRSVAVITSLEVMATLTLCYWGRELFTYISNVLKALWEAVP